MIKVIQVISDTNIGGAGKCVLAYLKAFDRTQFEVSAVFPKGSLLKEPIEALGISYHEVEGIQDKSLDFKIVKTLKTIFKEEKPDIVHTHASLSARIAAKLAGVPHIVYTRHCVYEPNPKLMTPVGSRINRLIATSLSDRIIAVAEAAKENIVLEGVPEKLVDVVQNGVEPLKPAADEVVQALREQYGVGENDFVTALVARLEPVKGHITYIEAAKILKEKGLPIKCLIAGTGSISEDLKEQVKQENLQNVVIFTGFLKDVSGIMSLMDVQMNASYGTEATSLSLLEGMSLGKPAVVTNFGGNPGVIENGENGFLVPIKDPKAMAEAIEKLYTDQTLYLKMSHRAKEIYEAKFTIDKMAQNIEAVYLNLMNHGGKQHD